MEQHRLVEFGRVDQTADPAYFIRFLDETIAEESFQVYKRRSFELLDVQRGARILEVGCGTGADARCLAQLVGWEGLVIGIDNSQAMIDEAVRRILNRDLPVRFQVGDALHLDFGDNLFDAARADRCTMHFPDPEGALREMIRVVRPGGKVLVYEVDFETLVIDAPDRGLARRIVQTWCDGFRNGWLGRQLPAMFRKLGLTENIVIPATLRLTPNLVTPLIGSATVNKAVANQTISSEEAGSWLKFLEESAAEDRLFSTLTGYLVRGQKPLA